MATRSDLWSTATPKRRITTYSKHFKRKPQKEEVGLNGRISTAPVESSVWDFHGDEDEISSPAVTLDKLKQKRPQHNRMRTISEMTPQRNPTTPATPAAAAVPRAVGAIVNPKKRRASLMGKEKAGTDGRAFSTPPSPPSSTEDRMPPPKTIPLPKPIKAPKTSQRRTSSLGSRSSPTAETISQTKTSLPFTFRAGKSVNDLTGKSVHDISHRLGHRKSLTQTHIPFRPVAAPRPPARLLPMTRPEKASSSRMSLGATLNQTAPRKKRRLIDELAAQANESSSEEEEGASASQATRRTPTPEPQGLSVVPQTPEPSRNRTYGRPGSAKKTGPKFTYSARRTIRTESSLSESQDSVDEMSWLRESILPSIPSQFDMDEEEEEEPFTKGAVRSIHELRQAGANSRSADEIDDLLTRIGRPSGKPSSGRRNALIELSQKMQDKAFVRKFRDHNGDRSLFEQIGKETDIISGYALVAILTTLMATTASTHIVSQLEGQGFAVLLRGLLYFPVDIQTLARDRASNLSRNGQQSMTKLKASLLILPVWAPTTPFMLSPRRLALKALELVVKNTGSVGDEFFSTEVTNYLFALLKNAPVPDAWAFPHSDESIDFQLALTLLEAHSMQAMQSEARERWTFTHMPVLADTLKSTLRQCNTRFGEVGMLVLKLALNTSNNNHDAPAAFIEKGTVRVLANALCDTFLAATNSVYNAETFTAFLEPVLVMSGIMINFSENDRATSKSLLLPSKSGQTALDRLITLFLDHHAVTAEADSVEKSQLNVAFGYLSLLLGYMSLYEPVRQRFSAMHKAGNVDPLISSIREFIIYYRAADSSIAEDGGEQSSQHSNFATKLQGLVERLEGYR